MRDSIVAHWPYLSALEVNHYNKALYKFICLLYFYFILQHGRPTLRFILSLYIFLRLEPRKGDTGVFDYRPNSSVSWAIFTFYDTSENRGRCSTDEHRLSFPSIVGKFMYRSSGRKSFAFPQVSFIKILYTKFSIFNSEK